MSAASVTQWADGLRELADFVDAHPPLFSYHSGECFNLFASSAEEMAALAREMGTAKKVQNGRWYILRRDFGPHRVELNIERERFCTRVQVGTRTVSRADPEAVAALPHVEVEEPVYEWECPDAVLKPVAS